MKTKSECEASLYWQTKMNRSIAIAMYVVFGIGVLVDIISWIGGVIHHFEIASTVLGYLFPLVFSCVILYHFFSSSDIEKEKEKIGKTLDSLKKEREYFEELALNEAQNQNPENIYQKKFEEIQQKIWKLEWKRKQIGG